MFKWRKGHIKEATIVGVIAMLLCVDPRRARRRLVVRPGSSCSRSTSSRSLLGVYGFAASVLPVWMLLTPRDYLSTFMKIGTIALLVIGVVIVNPELQAPAFSQFIGGGGPIIPGPLFPVRVHHDRLRRDFRLPRRSSRPARRRRWSTRKATSARSATARCCSRGSSASWRSSPRPSLHPGDYYAINTSPAVFATLKDAPACRCRWSTSGPAGAGRRKRHRPDRRRRLAGHRHGRHLQPPARHARPDGLLVPLRDHVRGALHPDDDRRRHARRAASRLQEFVGRV